MKGKRTLVMSILALFIFMAALVGSATADFNFTVSPSADFSYWPKSGAAPLIVTFVNESQRADSFEWTVWDRVIDQSLFDSSGETIIYQYLYPGTYPVYMTATNEAGTSVKVAYVTVLDSGLPSVSVEFIAAPRNGPAGTTVQFINLTPGEFDTFLWDFGDNSSDTTEDPSHVYNSPGLYTVSLTVFSSTLGFYDTETKVNYINIFPSSPSMINPDFVATPATGTDPQMVQFWGSGGEGKSVLWDFGDGTSSELLNPKHMYEEPGSYTVSLSVDGEVISKSDYVNVIAGVEGLRLPAALLLDDDEGQLTILRNFRDTVVSQTLPGLGLIELYYKYALEIVSILEADEELRAEAGAVLAELLPEFQSAIDGDSMTLTAAQLDKIKAVIGGIAAQAGSELGEVLAQIAIELSEGQLFENIGVSGSAE
jgi:PKD repeat protein